MSKDFAWENAMQQVALEGCKAAADWVHSPSGGADAAARRALVNNQSRAAAVAQVQDAAHHLHVAAHSCQ